MMASATPTPTRPDIFFLSLEHKSFFDDSYSSLINSISKVGNIKRAKVRSGAIRYLDANNPTAIIVTDEGLPDAANKDVLEKVKSYTLNGGRLIIGLHFTCFTNMDDFDKFFGEGLGLQWRSGDYHRTDFNFNSSCTLPAYVRKESLPSNVNLKVLHISNSQPHENIFVPISGARTQSLVFPPEAVDRLQAAVVGKDYGQGYLSYVGDVNGEEGSDMIILALCGL